MGLLLSAEPSKENASRWLMTVGGEQTTPATMEGPAMRAVIACALALPTAAGAALAQGEQTARTFHIAWSVKEPMKKQDWSGSARISSGRITEVVKDSGNADTVRPDMTWTIVYGRSITSDPNTRPRAKGLWITVEAADDAVLTVTTKGGEFSFALGEVKRRGIDALDGNVRITLAPRGPQRQQARAGRAQPVPITTIEGALVGEIPAGRISAPDRQSQWPAIAALPEVLVVAYVQWNGKDADNVVVAQRLSNAPRWHTTVLDDGCWDHYHPAVAARRRGAVVVWSAQKDGNFDLYWAEAGPGQKPEARRLTDSPHADFNARMVADPDGNVTLVWQSFRKGQSDVYARRLTARGWGKEIRVSPGRANDWEPAVALDSAGHAWIAWDSYATGNYDVFLRRLSGSRLGKLVRVTTEPTAQFHATVAVDPQDRAWVAWDDGGGNWGKDRSRSSSAPGSQGMHGSRALGVRAYANGRLYEPVAQLSDIMVGRLQRFAELPHLAFDAAGTLWMVFRHWTYTKPTEMFHFYATKLTLDGWAKPWMLADSSGQNTQHAAFAQVPNGPLAVAYASDGRSPDNLPIGQPEALKYNVYLAFLPDGAGGAVELTEVQPPKPQKAGPRRRRYSKKIGGKTYTLLWGDCHRHTDIRGHSSVDGSVLDSYRYAFDAAALDFVGMGDHNQVTALTWPDGLRPYHWWWTQKAADLMHTPPGFVGLYSYEHSLNRPSGHRNVIFLKRGGPLRLADRSKDSPDNLPPNLWKWMEENALAQRGQKIAIVPHTFASGPLADWNWPNAPFDCLLEIYQGCRGSYEAWGLPPGEKRGPTQTDQKGHFAQDALNVGNRYGFVSFSDHNSTHNSFACIWAESATREGILDAMLARRTYAASDEILLDVTADGHMMGEEFTAAEPPTLKVDITAPDTILRVDVVKNGLYVYTHEPNARQFSFWYRDTDPQPGTSYYYVRVFQRDPDAPDGDPEMAWASPFFVNYQ